MAAALIRRAGGLLGAGWIAGPIFGKELRISARRRRSFLLRFAYVAALTAFVGWMYAEEVMGLRGRPLETQISRMPEAGKRIIVVLVWFQFCAAQLILTVMLSTTISEEIRHRTLGVLMSTPIRSGQIVLGKLLSRVWQVLVLLAASVPVLLIVRVMGGVPMAFVVAGACTTVTTAVFLGSLSLYLSVHNPRMGTVVLKTLLLALVLFGLLPLAGFLLLGLGGAAGGLPGVLVLAFFFTNPYAVMVLLTGEVLTPGSTGGLWWPLHCGLSLAASAGVLSVTAGSVRRAALALAHGGYEPRRGVGAAPARARARRARRPGQIKRLLGSAVLWKDLRPSLFHDWRTALVALFAILAATLFVFVVCRQLGVLDLPGTHVPCLLGYLGIGCLVAAALAPRSLTVEKESGCWPLLLTTPLPAGRIVLDKAAAVALKVSPMWLLALGHLTAVAIAGYLHPVALLHGLLLVTYVTAFVTGVGLYFGAVCRRSGPAVLLTFAAILAAWVLLPMGAQQYSRALSVESDTEPDPLAPVVWNPGVQVVEIVKDGLGARGWELGYDGPSAAGGRGRLVSGRVAKSFLVHAAIGALLACAAGCRLRRRVF